MTKRSHLNSSRSINSLQLNFNERHKRQRLAILGTVVIGGLIIIIWFIIGPSTWVTNSHNSLFSVIQKQWQKVATEPKNTLAINTFQFKVEQIKDTISGANKQLIADPGQNFIITPPASWLLTDLRAGWANFTINSSNSTSSIIFQYPEKFFGVMVNPVSPSDQIAKWQGYPAMSITGDDKFKFISQRPLGYLSIVGTGPAAGGLINELINEVQFIK